MTLRLRWHGIIFYMPNLIIVHQSYQGSGESFFEPISTDISGQFILTWQTCRRRLIFLDESSLPYLKIKPSDEIYKELDAEEFLIQVLCGLKSPLLGETEVFGQFKLWWQNLDNSFFKNKFGARIQQIYAIVKKVREESLCGLGSQSYGSLLRKKISELTAKKENEVCIDFIGSGQLVEEIIPWIQKKWSYRIWCRNPERVKQTDFGQKAAEIKNINELATVSKLVVVAAPLQHEHLNHWLKLRSPKDDLSVFDFRHDSMSYAANDLYQSYLHLDHFTGEVHEQKQTIQNNIQEAKEKIFNWKNSELMRAQVRPFGWDDL